MYLSLHSHFGRSCAMCHLLDFFWHFKLLLRLAASVLELVKLHHWLTVCSRKGAQWIHTLVIFDRSAQLLRGIKVPQIGDQCPRGPGRDQLMVATASSMEIRLATASCRSPRFSDDTIPPTSSIRFSMTQNCVKFSHYSRWRNFVSTQNRRLQLIKGWHIFVSSWIRVCNSSGN